MPNTGHDFSALLQSASSSALAFVSTLHVALALLRRERLPARRASRALLVPSFAFAVSPWLLPSLAGVAVGIAAHLAWFLACERLVPPAAQERRVPASHAPSRPPAGFVPARVLSIADETPDIRTFRLARPAGFEFRAGQFLSVRAPTGEAPLVRCYTISSSPAERGHLEITVKRQGRASSALHDRVRPGTLLPIRGPAGGFLYPEGCADPIVLLGAGVGATPLVSMLRWAAAREPWRPVTLVLSARTESDIPFRRELDAIAATHPRARIVLTATRSRRDPRLFPGRIDESLIRSVVEAPLESLYYLCGPLPMIETMGRLLAGIGVEPSRVRSEAFEAAVAWAAGAGAAARPSAPPATPARLELARSGREARIAPGQTLLEAAEAAGAGIESSCRSGICGTCRTRLLRGEVEGGGELDAAERDEGWILPCVAFARGDCVLDE